MSDPNTWFNLQDNPAADRPFVLVGLTTINPVEADPPDGIRPGAPEYAFIALCRRCAATITSPATVTHPNGDSPVLTAHLAWHDQLEGPLST